MTLVATEVQSYLLGLLGDGKQPTLEELELAERQHRWAEVRRVERDFFRTTMHAVTLMEQDALRALRLPAIDRVRESVAEGETGEGPQWSFGPDRLVALRRVLADFVVLMVGASEALPEKAAEQESVYETFMRRAYAVGFLRALRDLLRRNPRQAERVARLALSPTFEDIFWRSMVHTGGYRIRTEIALRWWPKVREALLDMAKQGRGALPVARFLHKEIGEGKAWYWKRITRSETTIAVGRGFDELAAKAAVNYEEWSAASNCCEVCAVFDGKVWPRGDGPRPVVDTHPHCRCVRIALYETEKPVNSPWVRESPYDVRYTPDELEALRRFLQ